MKPIHAMFENGDFRPAEPVDFPEGSPIALVAKLAESWEATQDDLNETYAILSERDNSGQHDVAAHHNEHQP